MAEIAGDTDHGVVDVDEHLSGFAGLELRRVACRGRALATRRLFALKFQYDLAEAGVADTKDRPDPVGRKQPSQRKTEPHSPGHFFKTETLRSGFDSSGFHRI